MIHKPRILDEALSLTPVERANLADQLLASLNKPDEAVDELWREEIQTRIAAYESGRIEAVSLDQVMKKHRK